MICKLFVEKYWINTQCLLYIISYANKYPAGLCIVNSLGFIMKNISLAPGSAPERTINVSI